MQRQQLCTPPPILDAKIGDTLLVTGTSPDASKFVCSGDVFLGTAKAAAWHNGEIAGGTAQLQFAQAGTYTGIIDVAFIGTGSLTLQCSVTPKNGGAPTQRVCEFSGNKGDLGSSIVTLMVT
jgi:hypothetical protein